MPFFTTFDSTQLTRHISTAKQHVIFAGPGLRLVVASALIEAQTRLGQGYVQVVLDPDPNVSRVGYGEHQAVLALMDADVPIRKHSGLRLAVLICDGQGWAFSTPAQLVEPDPTVDADAFNAVALTEAQVIALRSELPAIADLKAPPPLVGELPLSRAELNESDADLKRAPPQKFDLARQTQVYSAMIQFVELELVGFNLRARQVRFPSTLPLLATDNQSLKARITASLQLLGSQAPPKELEELKGAIEAIRKKYLVPMGDAGRIILKKDLPEFTQKLQLVRDELETCRVSMTNALSKSLADIMVSISREIAENLVSAPPLGLRLLSNPPTIEAAEAFAVAQLEEVFPAGKELVAGMQIRIYFKDLTYATLNDPDFRERLKPFLSEEMKSSPLFKQDIAALLAGSEEKA